ISAIQGGQPSHLRKLGHRYADHPHRTHRKNGGSWRGTEVQSLLFTRPQWTPASAKTWAHEHGYKSGKVHATERYIRLRQFEPIAGTQKRTIVFGDGIKAVIEQVK